MPSALLQFVSKYQNRDARHLRVFVHGYLSATDDIGRARLMEHVPQTGNDEDAVFTFWDSGRLRDLAFNSFKGAAPGLRFTKLGLALAAVQAARGGFSHYSEKKKQVLVLGNTFFDELTQYCSRYPHLQSISLYGHSLGARLLVEALLAAKGHPAITVDNLVLLGAALALDEQEITQILPALQGKIYNFYSRSDKVLQMRPSLRKWAGRHPLPNGSMPERILNIQMNVGHSGYWNELPTVFNHMQHERQHLMADDFRSE